MRRMRGSIPIDESDRASNRLGGVAIDSEELGSGPPLRTPPSRRVPSREYPPAPPIGPPHSTLGVSFCQERSPHPEHPAYPWGVKARADIGSVPVRSTHPDS